MKRIPLAIAPFLIFALTAGAEGDLTATRVNGTWRLKNNEFKVWALGQQRLQIEFF